MELISRYRGCLLAGAVGDALGYPVEFDRLPVIRRRFGDGGVRTMGQYITDDTQMTLFTAEGLLMGRAHGMPTPDCIYQSYLDWYHTQYPQGKGGAFRKGSKLLQEKRLHALRAPGNTCLAALRSGKMGTIDEPINRSKGCGGVMRTAPCGLLRMASTPDPEDAWALQGAQAGAITHGHPMGYVPAAMLADMVHMICLEDGRTLTDIVLDSLQRMNRLFGEQRDFNFLMARAVELATDGAPVNDAIRELGEGWVGDEALAIAVYCVLRFPDDMEEALCAAVTHDGDSDSTGAIAGNILGAWLGEDAIPARWLEELEMQELIRDVADALYEAAR